MSSFDLHSAVLVPASSPFIAAVTTYWRVYSLHNRHVLPTGGLTLGEPHPAGPDGLAYKSIVLPSEQFLDV
jgi:hypothetical protein